MAAKDLRAPDGLGLPRWGSWPWRRGVVLAAGDVLALAVAWRGGLWLNQQFFSPIPPPLVWWVWFGLPSIFWVMLAVTVALFAYHGLYGTFAQAKNYVQAGWLVTVPYLVVLILVYVYDPKLDLPRSLFFSAWFGSIATVIAMRLGLGTVLRPYEQIYAYPRIFLIAPEERLNPLAAVLQRRSHCVVVGTAIAATAHSATTQQAILESGATLVLMEGMPGATLTSTVYWQLRRAGIGLRLLPSSREMLFRRGVPEVVAGLPTLRLDARPLARWEYPVKRLMDYCGAGLGVLLLLPLGLAIALAIRLDSPGPIFFRQPRIGLHGKPFRVWKFRTMVANAPQMQADLEAQNQGSDGVLFKLKADPRITPVGQFLRRTSLDELPQLLNVLQGQMSLVGPRPLPLRDVAHFEEWHHIRHQVLPGITGLWQISGRSDIDSFDDAARLDLYYIDNWSLNLDLDILLETCRIVFLGKGAY